jgi:hypothetical protein
MKHIYQANLNLRKQILCRITFLTITNMMGLIVAVS